MKLPEILSRFPAFKAWAEEKRLAPGELDILAEFPDSCFAGPDLPEEAGGCSKESPEKAVKAGRRAAPEKPPAPLLEWIARHRPSHSQGAQILETGGELLLMGRSLAPLLQKETSSKSLLAGLRSLRFPLAAAKARQREEILKSLPWPRAMKARQLREGDQAGLEIAFQSFSLKDFSGKIKSLERICEQLKSQPDDFWESAAAAETPDPPP